MCPAGPAQDSSARTQAVDSESPEFRSGPLRWHVALFPSDSAGFRGRERLTSAWQRLPAGPRAERGRAGPPARSLPRSVPATLLRGAVPFVLLSFPPERSLSALPTPCLPGAEAQPAGANRASPTPPPGGPASSRPSSARSPRARPGRHVSAAPPPSVT